MILIPTPETDPHWRAPVIAYEAGCRWIAAPMLYNYRLLCVPDDGMEAGIAAYGWCYRTPEALIAAAPVFDPLTQEEPLGWHKRPAGDIRRAPARDRDPGHNRPRCEHGSYLHSGRCTISEHCTGFVRSHANRGPR